ncbi:carboxymuconolactone decarboxylase family protein [Acetobacter sp. AN02]|uniref:carboxymuconolactone decarboxylase family protein n=1 Tax=Acetobacter sp. AN02 TaxID=2894186 RepID=UPI0024345EC5|nr:carboxymuconolactone decarboxylase family protein [Acetobacter sp. AN02]MDG6095589.1 carboxymuconolactone decarboxylase family protein [Acetobacter sp. AN02]
MADTQAASRPFSPELVSSVSPALEAHTVDRLKEVWTRPGLSFRDRSLISIAALITRGQVAGLGLYTDHALNNGVTPSELSETVLQLAYYAGWANALSATPAMGAVFAARGISADQLPAEIPDQFLPLEEPAEAQRTKTVGEQFEAVAPGLVDYTTRFLFRDLWLRPGLAPRDRSLVTVAALVTAGQAAQITFHLTRAMDNGLTREQASEVVTHLAFYAGWPNAMSALPVFKDVFAKRGA